MPSATRNADKSYPDRTVSEVLFEEYLNQSGVAVDFEPIIAGKKKRPDFRVRWGDQLLWCEVKELHEKRPRPKGPALFNPYASIRKMIQEARKKFKEFKNETCVLVLYNVDDWEFREWPYVLFGAMLGDLGVSNPLDTRAGRLLLEQTRSTYSGGGQMIDRKNRVAQNKTISAIAVLSEITIPNPVFEKEYEKRLAEMQRSSLEKPTIEQRLEARSELYERFQVTLGQCPRVCVFENPLARHQLPDSVFCGEFDSRHRFNAQTERIERTFAGAKLMNSELLHRPHMDILQQLEEFKQGIIQHFQPERIVLFGSHAYGQPEPDSDVDLLVLFRGNGSAADRSLAIRKRLNPAFPLDLLTRSTGEVERRLKLGDDFLNEILNTGKTLYESSHN